ncbi:MAG: hypothetical protein WBC85_02365, partial [Planktotalea sp.]
MKVEFIAGGFLTVFTGLAGIVVAAGHFYVALVCFAVGVVSAIVAISINDTTVLRKIGESLKGPSYRLLYDILLDWLLPKARALFGVAEPDSENAALPALLKQSFTYRLLDRAMLFAVIYPLLLLLAYWGLTGRAGTLGAVEVIPALPEGQAWKGPVTLCGIAIVGLVALYGERRAA